MIFRVGRGGWGGVGCQPCYKTCVAQVKIDVYGKLLMHIKLTYLTVAGFGLNSFSVKKVGEGSRLKFTGLELLSKFAFAL